MNFINPAERLVRYQTESSDGSFCSFNLVDSEISLIYFENGVVAVFQVLSVIPDQDTFYDVVDALEDQGLERIIQQTCKSRGVRSDIVEEFRRYESALRQEDNTESSQKLDLIENVRYDR